MKCYYHDDKNAVSQCSQCGKFLCKNCSDEFIYNGSIVCKDCANKIDENKKQFEIEEYKHTKINLILITILWLIFILGMFIPNMGTIFGIYVIFLIVYLRKYIPIPKTILNLNMLFWIVVFFIYISWGIFYLIIIYPIRYGRILFKPENKKIKYPILSILVLGMLFLIIGLIGEVNQKPIGERLGEIENKNNEINKIIDGNSIKKESKYHYSFFPNGNGTYTFLGYGANVNMEDKIKKLAESKGVNFENVKIVRADSDEDIYHKNLILNSSNPENMEKFLNNLTKGGNDKDWDNFFQTIYIYNISADLKELYEDEIKEIELFGNIKFNIK